MNTFADSCLFVSGKSLPLQKKRHERIEKSLAKLDCTGCSL